MLKLVSPVGVAGFPFSFSTMLHLSTVEQKLINSCRNVISLIEVENGMNRFEVDY